MSRYILNQLKCCRSRFTTCKPLLTTQTTARNFCNNSDKNALSQTTILVQNGCDIQELPVIMRKIGHDEIVALCSNASSVNDINCRTLDDLISVNDIDADVIVDHLNECVSSRGCLSLIDSVPEAELTPEIAVVAFYKIFHLESLIQLKNLESSNEVYNKIVNCLVTKGDNKCLLDMLDCLQTLPDLTKTIQRICNELLTRSTDGILNVIEICESIHRFIACQQKESAEKFWSGLADQEKQINENNIKFIYQVLPKLKVSRRMVIGVLERKITNVFCNLSPQAVIEILDALVESNQMSFRTMKVLTRWLNINIHAVSEVDLEHIIKGFTLQDHSDGQIEKAIERYMKTKGIKIQNQSLVCTILAHCQQFRIRNPHIMNGCSEYFIVNVDEIRAENLKSIIYPFGYLNYQPINSIKFWQIFEKCLHSNFEKISPIDVIDIMLSCIYLEKYPINFIQRIFNPYFLDVLLSTTPMDKHSQVRSNLKLLDTALTIECERNGPLLPKDYSAKSHWQDGRITRIVQNLTDQWTIIAGGLDKFSKSVVHQQLPLNSLYIIDLLIHPPGMGVLWNFNRHTDRNVYVATIVHLPEHYDLTKENLIGPQSMRIRHFRRLGLKVVTLNYEILLKLRVHGEELHKYLVERMQKALPATG